MPPFHPTQSHHYVNIRSVHPRHLLTSISERLRFQAPVEFDLSDPHYNRPLIAIYKALRPQASFGTPSASPSTPDIIVKDVSLHSILSEMIEFFLCSSLRPPQTYFDGTLRSIIRPKQQTDAALRFPRPPSVPSLPKGSYTQTGMSQAASGWEAFLTAARSLRTVSFEPVSRNSWNDGCSCLTLRGLGWRDDFFKPRGRLRVRIPDSFSRKKRVGGGEGELRHIFWPIRTTRKELEQHCLR